MGTSQRKAKDLIWKTLSGISVFGFAFVVSYLSSSHFAPVSESEAASSTYYASISSSESIDITLQSTPDGVYKVGKDSLSIDTNSTLGYKLYISTEDKSSSNLPSTTPANGLIDSATGAYISPSSGTVDTPVRLSTNTWGYTVSRSSSSEASTSYVDSDAAPTEAKGGLAVWRAVPEYGNEDIFYTNSSPATASTNSVDVYYAVNASTALPSGTYSNTVVYTAIVEGNVPSSTEDLAISPTSQTGLASTTTVTISTGLYPGFSVDNLGEIAVTIGDNACTNITPSIDSTNGNLVVTCIAPARTTVGTYDVNLSIAKGGATYYSSTLASGYTYNPGSYSFATCAATATGGTFTQDGVTYIKLKDGNCWTKESQGIMNWETAVALNSEGAYNICPAGTHNPSAQELNALLSYYGGSEYPYYGSPYGYHTGSGAMYNATGWSGNFWTSTEYASASAWYMVVDPTNSDMSMTSKTNNLNIICVGSTVPEFYAITDMQQMNHSICASVPAPIGPTESGTNFTNVITKSNWTSTSAGTPQTTLVDTRSGTAKTSYTIRKFPDGKCWMARNLRYAPTAATTLSSGSSDILSSNTWQMPKLGTYNSGATDYNGDEVYEGSYGATYDTTYYSWHTATAGTGTYDVASGNTTQSICPKNWRLPTSGDGTGTTAYVPVGDTTESGDFKQLNIAFGGDNGSGAAWCPTNGLDNWINSTYGFGATYNAYFSGNSFATNIAGTYGVYTSATAYSNEFMLYQHVYKGHYACSAGADHRKGLSHAVRCVAR